LTARILRVRLSAIIGLSRSACVDSFEKTSEILIPPSGRRRPAVSFTHDPFWRLLVNEPMRGATAGHSLKIERGPGARRLSFEPLEDRSTPASLINVSWTGPQDPPPAQEVFAVVDTNAGADGYGAIGLVNAETGIGTTLSSNSTVGYRAWGHPTGGAVETINGIRYLIVADPYGGRDGYGAIRRVNLQTGEVQLVTDNWKVGYRALVRPKAIAIEPTAGGGHYLLVVDSAGGRDGRGAVKRINPTTGSIQLMSDNYWVGYRAFSAPVDAVLETANGVNYLLVVDPSGGRDGYGAVRRVDLQSGGVQLVVDNWLIGYRGLNRPSAGMIETSGGDRYLRVVDPDGGAHGEPTVRLINLLNRSMGLTGIGGEMRQPRGIAGASDGSRYVLDGNRFGTLDVLIDHEDLDLVAVALSSYQTGYFADSANELYYKNGTHFQRVGIGLAKLIVTRDRQEAYGLRHDGLLFKYQGGAPPYVLQTRVLSVNLNGDGQTVFIQRQSRSAFAESPSDGYSLVASDHLLQIRQDPSRFDDYYWMYAGQVSRELGFRFSSLTDEGKMAVFATIVAYQMKPYGFNATLVNMDHDATLARLLAAPQMACDRYCYFAMMLYERGRKDAGLQPLTWNMVGFDVNSAIGNHAQLFVLGGGLPLMLDPTFGLVARTELNYLMNGNALGFSYVREPAYRVENSSVLAADLYGDLSAIRTALFSGKYSTPRNPVSSGWSPIIYQHAENVLGL
jgi:hypothetical protein